MSLPETKSEQDTQPISRRRLIQIISVGGSATLIAAFMPQQWSTPRVQVGYLPAHAQGSPQQVSNQFTIANLQRTFEQLNNCTGPNGGTGTVFTVSFSYQNDFGDINENITLRHETMFNPTGFNNEYQIDNFTITGDGFTGQISYRLCTSFGINTELITAVQLVDVAGRESNRLSLTTLRPPNATDVGRAYEAQ